MYKYTICNMPDDEIFYKQCKAIEKKVPIKSRMTLLEDVDGSMFQGYEVDGGKVTVINSHYIGYVGVESDVELEQYFK
ncbi:MAG: hypothetical protein RSD65_06305 [Anaerovoracaceae bacterium]